MRRSHAVRSVRDLQADRTLAIEPRSGKTGAAIANFEHDARLGRSAGMFDDRARIDTGEPREQRVIGYFARKPYVLRIDARRGARKQS
jgi:hypothetical protein